MSSRNAVFIASLAVVLAVAGVATAKKGGRPLATAMRPDRPRRAPGPGDAGASGQVAIDLAANQGHGRFIGRATGRSTG